MRTLDTIKYKKLDQLIYMYLFYFKFPCVEFMKIYVPYIDILKSVNIPIINNNHPSFSISIIKTLRDENIKRNINTTEI